MDKKNNSKKQHSKKMVESGVSSKKMGKGNKVKVKKYWTVDHMQSCFYDLPEGLKIPSNRSGKAILDRNSPNMDPSHPYKYIFFGKPSPMEQNTLSDLVFGSKRTKVGPRRQTKVVTPPRHQEAEDLFHEVFFGNSSSNL